MTKFKVGDRVWFEGNKFTLVNNFSSEEDNNYIDTIYPLQLDTHNISFTLSGCQLIQSKNPSIKLVKKRALKKTDFEIGDKVTVSFKHFEFLPANLDMLYHGKEEAIRSEDLGKLFFHTYMTHKSMDVSAEVIGYGNDDSVRVNFTDIDYELNLTGYKYASELIDIENLKRIK